MGVCPWRQSYKRKAKLESFWAAIKTHLIILHAGGCSREDPALSPGGVLHLSLYATGSLCRRGRRGSCSGAKGFLSADDPTRLAQGGPRGKTSPGKTPVPHQLPGPGPAFAPGI